ESSAEERPDAHARDRRDELPSKRRLAVVAIADDEVRAVARRPDRREPLRAHLVVAVRLEDPFAPGLAVAAEDRRPVAAVLLPDGDQRRLLARERPHDV